MERKRAKTKVNKVANTKATKKNMIEVPKEIDWRVPRCHAWPGSEASLQVDIVTRSLAFVNDHPEILTLYAIPNGDWRGWGTGIKLKAQGVLPGIPDLCLPVMRGGFGALYIELKKKGGAVKPCQIDMMMNLKSNGNQVFLCNSSSVAIMLIESYLKSNDQVQP